MREFASPLTVRLPTGGNLTDDVVANGEQHADTACFARREGDGWADVTAAQFLAEVRSTAKGLVAAGVQIGDRIAILSKTRYEWTLLDYAGWFAGAVTVPIYETSSADQLEWILTDSGARAIVVETAEHVRRVSRLRERLPELTQVWSFDGNAVDVLSRLGHDVSDDELERRRRAAGPGDLATIVYTSGTTGRPKGCMLTHGNFAAELGTATSDLHELFEVEDASTLLFLPLAHVFARIIQVGAVKKRVRLGHTSDVSHLVDDLAGFRPTFVLAVPRVFEKVFNQASQRAASEGRGRVFDAAVTTAIAYSRALDAGRPGRLLRLRHAVFDRLVYRRLRAALGGRCEYAVSGGAPLGERLGHFYRGVGVTVLEGYGLTESTGAVTVNTPDALTIGSVGRPLSGTTVRVAGDGELLVRGGQVMRGYWRNQAATADMVDGEGWLRTGDVGEIDAQGHVWVTGRKKEILVTAGGKNVAPAVLEDRLRGHHLVDQCMVVGDGKPFIAALVTIDPDLVPAWAEQHGRPADIGQLVDDPRFRAEIQAAVDDANKAVSKAESIRKFAILPVDWTEEGGELTPSLKLRRTEVMRRHRADVEALYDS